MAQGLSRIMALLMGVTLMACEPQAQPADSPSTSPRSSGDAATKTLTLDPANRSKALTFLRYGEQVKTLSVEAMSQITPMEQWSAYDPYYKKVKTWKAFALKPVLEEVYKDQEGGIVEQELILRANDGYQVLSTGAAMMRPGAYIAVEDAEHVGWELVGPRRANPGPFYLVWRQEDQQDPEQYPRPWQLTQIELARFEQLYPRTVPTGAAPGSLEREGYELFKAQCSRCHAINQQGGRLGPELNIPQNITEYRPEAQIRAYIKNPMTFRYGNMPAFAHFEERQLDSILAYLKAMSALKQMPEPPPSSP